MMRFVLLALLIWIAPPAGAAETAIPFDGNWELEKDTPDGVLRALRIEGYSTTFYWDEADEITYAYGSLMGSAQADGRWAATLVMDRPAITDTPEFEPIKTKLVFKRTGDGTAEIWTEGVPERWGTMRWTACTLTMTFRDRTDTPPEGCSWAETIGVGFDGLVGECVWKQEWEENWETVRRNEKGELSPSACLIDVPASFEGEG
jgi:hypothetical protein